MDLGYTHAVTLYGYRVRTNKKGKTIGHWRMQNSWGAGWGIRGTAKIDLFGENDGVCNINRYGVWSVDFDLDSLEPDTADF